MAKKIPEEQGETLLSIGEAARFVGVAPQTLRRWAKAGRLQPSVISPGKHRYYTREDLLRFVRDHSILAQDWASSSSGAQPPQDVYCRTSSEFQARLSTMETALRTLPDLQEGERFSLLTAVVGEIGDNAFSHNLGAWPDLPGVYYAYDLRRRYVVVADRGVGVLATLRRVRPALQNDTEALTVAFTERLSGRTPENRGNGLKFVRQVIAQSAFTLRFQSGDAILAVRGGSDRLEVSTASAPIRGTYAFITF